MKKGLLAFAAGLLLTASAMDAANNTVYFKNTDGWNKVYAYTWAPADSDPYNEIFPSDVKDGDVALYSLTTDKDNVIFLNKNTFTEAHEQTAKLLVVNGEEGAPVYNAASQLIGHVNSNLEYVAIEAGDIVEVNTGIYLLGTFNEWDATSAYQFTKKGNVYTLAGVTIEKGAKFKIAEADLNPAWCGDIEISANPKGGDAKSYTLDENTEGDGVNLTAGDNLYGVTLTLEGNELTVSAATEDAPVITYYGAFNNSGSWTLAGQFEDGKLSVAVGDNNVFAIFRTVGTQDWKEGTRYAAGASTGVTLGDPYTITPQAGTFTLDNTVKVGNWVVTLTEGENITVSFAQEAQAILINTVATALTNGRWTGSLAKEDNIEFFYNGETLNFTPGTSSISGNNVTVPGTLAGEDVYEFPYNSSDVVINVNFTAKTATIIAGDALSPVMLVGTQSFALTENDGVYTGAVTLTPGATLSFEIGDKVYAAESYPEVEVADGKAVVTFAESANATAWDFITETTKANVSFDTATGEATFTWNAETGVEGIEADNNGEAVYFNLQGVRVANPENGIFIEVKGGKAVKVVK